MRPLEATKAAPARADGSLRVDLLGGEINPRIPQKPAIGQAPDARGAQADESAPDPFNLERLGPWEILRRDPTGKRAVARCVNCQTVREISVVDGIASCGCARARMGGAATFASSIVAAETRGATNRHKGGGRA